MLANNIDREVGNNAPRILARRLARELNADEIQSICGGVVNSKTESGTGQSNCSGSEPPHGGWNGCDQDNWSDIGY